jgi:NTP pyrophosphatase (non-canonical NTP hydrolase)
MSIRICDELDTAERERRERLRDDLAKEREEIMNRHLHDAVLDEVTAERERQERLRDEGKFPHTCASRGLSYAEKYAILGEEVGEVARHVTEGVIDVTRVDVTKLRKELIEVAAVAVAWAESLTR